MSKYWALEEHEIWDILKNNSREQLGLNWPQFTDIVEDLFVRKTAPCVVMTRLQKYQRENQNANCPTTYDEPETPCESEHDYERTTQPESSCGIKRPKGKKSGIPTFKGKQAPEQVRHDMPCRMMRDPDDIEEEILTQRQPISFRSMADMPKCLRDQMRAKYQHPKAPKRKQMHIPEADNFEPGLEDVCVTPQRKNQIPCSENTGRSRRPVGVTEEHADKACRQNYLNPIRIEATTPIDAIDNLPSGSIIQIYRESDEGTCSNPNRTVNTPHSSGRRGSSRIPRLSREACQRPRRND